MPEPQDAEFMTYGAWALARGSPHEAAPSGPDGRPLRHQQRRLLRAFVNGLKSEWSAPQVTGAGANDGATTTAGAPATNGAATTGAPANDGVATTARVAANTAITEGAMTGSLRRRKRLTLACMCFALFMVMLDSTVVNLALKTIQVKMGASFSEVQWIVDAFVLALASLLLTGGTLGDLSGRRRAFIAGLALFTGGSVLCALAPSTSFLIGARGAGHRRRPHAAEHAVDPHQHLPRPRERARAIGMWAGISGLALAVGPLIGGFLVDRFDWQSIFWINVPIGVVALVMALLLVPESSDRAGRDLDLVGQVTAVIGLVALTYAFIEANSYGWTSARIVSCFVVSAIALSLFIVVELRGKTPLLQLKFFRNGTFAGANLVGVIVSFAFFGVIFFLSLFMQEVQGYTPTQAGALQLPATLGIMAAAILSGRIVGRFGARLPITVGLCMTGTALLCLTSVQPDTATSRSGTGCWSWAWATA